MEAAQHAAEADERRQLGMERRSQLNRASMKGKSREKLSHSRASACLASSPSLNFASALRPCPASVCILITPAAAVGRKGRPTGTPGGVTHRGSASVPSVLRNQPQAPFLRAAVNQRD